MVLAERLGGVTSLFMLERTLARIWTLVLDEVGWDLLREILVFGIRISQMITTLARSIYT